MQFSKHKTGAHTGPLQCTAYLRDLVSSISHILFGCQEETWIDAFASKDQLAYQYGYVLIACNERGEFSPPSTVAMVRPKKDDRRTPRSPKRDSWRGH